MHRALTPGNRVRAPGGARGSDGNPADLASSKEAACAFDSRLPYSFPGGLPAAQQASEVCPRWFDPSPGSHAAAHGCGSAFVRRTARVGTGWRLHVLVLQPGREAGPRCRMLRVRLPPSALAPGPGGPVSLVRTASRGRHLAGAHGGRLLCWQGPPAFEAGISDAGSSPARPARCPADRRPPVPGTDWPPGSAPG